MHAVILASESPRETVGLGRRHCARHGKVIGVDVRSPELESIMDDFEPTHVVHLAGMTSPAQADQLPEMAWEMNVVVTKRITDWAKNHDSWLLYPSTDFVWGPDRGRPWRETDRPTAMSHYARSKVVAAGGVLSHERGCVTRLSLLYGLPLCPRETTWTRVFAAFAAGSVIPACTDEVRTPLRLEDAAQVIAELGRRRHAGLLHVAGPEAISPYELFERLARSVGKIARLEPVGREQLQGGSQRPPNMAMDAAALAQLLPHVEIAAPPRGSLAQPLIVP
ncbi:MAG: sugar nucleotide-binding protein [Intrasporangium sp.]|nr:sugar nucleotide-binding protein [Intrasporangium sp.]